MPRRIRIEEPGYYHILNRGVEKRKVFLSKEDKDKFITIMCEEFIYYEITLHSYVLMDNHYHLLISNKKKNLSDVMRQVNSKYAIYFNKKYDRVGHLWQDRFKSWMIFNENYLFTLFKYFELNPIKAKLTNNYGVFYRSFLYDIINGSILECCKDSLFLQYSTKSIFSILDIELNEKDIEILQSIKKENRNLKKDLIDYEQKNIEDFLSKEYKTKSERNKMIINAYKNGIKQVDIAKFYNLTISSISKIINK